jgi:hypothetical protein
MAFSRSENKPVTSTDAFNRPVTTSFAFSAKGETPGRRFRKDEKGETRKAHWP